jgi:lysyl-tRNA synthetase class 2
MSDARWWNPQVHADRRPILIERGRIRAAMGAWFAGQGFVEVDPAGLQVSPGNEAHLHAFRTVAVGNDGAGREMYLHTSPEFAMKKLLAAGETRIAAFVHVWRNRERGRLHSPEFTMLEWYRAGEGYDVLMEDVMALLRLAGPEGLRFGEAVCDPFVPFERVSVAEAVARHARIDLLATMGPGAKVDRDGLAVQMQAAGMRVAADDTWSDMLSAILVTKVEPKLGMGRVTVLDRYPAAEAALARRAGDDDRVAERFEVYACGVELANGFGELTDAREQRRRFVAEMDEKARVYGERYPIDEDFLAALEIMPEASGIAMGFDRVVMLATGAPRIDDVLWVPVG